MPAIHTVICLPEVGITRRNTHVQICLGKSVAFKRNHIIAPILLQLLETKVRDSSIQESTHTHCPSSIFKLDHNIMSAPEEEINPYELLSVTTESTEQEIRTAYRQRSLKVHPDRVRLRVYLFTSMLILLFTPTTRIQTTLMQVRTFYRIRRLAVAHNRNDSAQVPRAQPGI